MLKFHLKLKKYISDNFREGQLKKLSKVIGNQKTNPYDIYLSTNTELVETGLSPDYKPIYKRVKHLYAIVKRNISGVICF